MNLNIRQHIDQAQARIDIKNQGINQNDVNISMIEGNANITQPQWFLGNGNGYVLETSDSHIVLELSCVQDGELLVILRGISFYNEEGKRLPLKVDYLRVTIDGEIFISSRKTFWHDQPYPLRKKVSDGQRLIVEILWEPHGYKGKELLNFVSLAYPSNVCRKNYALVTGAIRSDFYLRCILIKLCELREKSVIKQIVLSTWKGEVDKFTDLRKCLEQLKIILVETPCLDEGIESRFNNISTEIQRTTIAAGLAVIPNDCFVLKLRTDLLEVINQVLDSVEQKVDLDVESFGDFPKIYRYKTIMFFYSLNRMPLLDDKCFYGYKTDLDKLFFPVMYKKSWKYSVTVDNELTCGYLYRSYPMLKAVWDIVSWELIPKLINYCNRTDSRNIELPRIFVRMFAFISVFLHTHIHIADSFGNPLRDKSVAIIDLFRDKIRNNDAIRKMLRGEVTDYDTPLARVFYEELRKISLNDPSINGYTKSEYEELKKFVSEELAADASLIGEYPFKEIAEVSTVSREMSVRVLLSRYDDDKFTSDVSMFIGECFGNITKMHHKIVAKPKSKEAILKAAVFDMKADHTIAIDYMRYLKAHADFFDITTWNQALRYMRMGLQGGNISKDYMVALNYAIDDYVMLYSKYREIVNSKGNLWSIVKVNLKHLAVNYLTDIRSSFDYQCELVRFLNKNDNKKLMDRNEIIVVDVFLEIMPKNNPFAPVVLERLKMINDHKRINMIRKVYGEIHYNQYDWEVDSKAIIMIRQDDILGLLTYCENASGKKNIEYIIRYLILAYLKGKNQLQILSAMKKLTEKMDATSFVVKISNYIQTGKLNIALMEMVSLDNFVFLLEIIYKSGCLSRNLDSLKEVCLDERWRKLILEAFNRMDKDNRVDFFSMKNAYELWLYYVPYLEYEANNALVVPVAKNGQTWPGADRKNKSSFAAFMRLVGEYVYISIELSAKDVETAREIAKAVGFEEKNSPGNVIRLKTKRLPLKDERNLPYVVNEALDEFCEVGEKLVVALKRSVSK